MLRRVTAFAGLLVIPLALLLFAQWPLRDGLQNYARQANDVAQMVFALYAAVAVTAATLSGRHLALETYSVVGPKPSWRAWALLLCVG